MFIATVCSVLDDNVPQQCCNLSW